VRRLGAMLLAGGLSLGLAASLAVAQEIGAPPKTAASSAQPTPPVPPPSAAAPMATPLPSQAVQPPAAAPPPEDDAPVPRAAAPAPPEPPKPPPEPLKRPRFNAAILQGVDKITAETLRFEARVGEPVRYKGLILTVRACETTAADESIDDNVAYVEVQSQPEVLPGRAAAPPRQVFKGWMFASSPTLHPLEHPVYDLWLIACKTAGPGA
jgi:hypothetical protein